MSFAGWGLGRGKWQQFSICRS